MKYMFIPAYSKIKIELTDEVINILPEKTGLVTTIQYINQFEDIKNQLEKAEKQVFYDQGRHTNLKGQILGCDHDVITKVIDKIDATLYVGDGLFHPKIIGFRTDKPVFMFNPLSKKLTEIQKSDIEQIMRKKKGALAKFYSSDSIGIIVTTKYGQHNFEGALELKKKLKEEGKQAYIFVCDTLDFSEMENFPFIDCYVNTMCPRIGYDDTIRTPKPIVNLHEIHKGSNVYN